MPIGLIVNCLSVALGGLLGAAGGKLIPQRLKDVLPAVFGISAIGIGVVSITRIINLPAVILAVIAGFIIGELLKLEQHTARFFHFLLDRKPFSSKKIDMEQFITIVTIFCVSGLGVFGAITEGVSGDSSILLSKSVLDFFTAAIFAASMGIAVSMISLLQFFILIAVFLSSTMVAPLITPDMMADFTACGGILTIAAGLRIAKIKSVPIVNMIPALLIVFFTSKLWSM